MRDYHLEKHVLLPGFRTDVLGCLKSFDLFVMSSVTEGPRHVAARRDGLLAADRRRRGPGIPEVVEDGVTGVLVEPRDPKTMADAIVTLIEDRARRAAMGDAGLARVNARFTVERMIAGTAAVYARVAGTPHAEDTAHQPARG